jgi:hypothetical protein
MYGLDRMPINQLQSFNQYPPARGPLTSGTPLNSKKVEAVYPFDRAKRTQCLTQPVGRVRPTALA